MQVEELQNSNLQYETKSNEIHFKALFPTVYKNSIVQA